MTAEIFPSKQIKAESLTRDYRKFRAELPADPRLRFELHHAK